jgi:diguanylate cyclase (GGDEF)-like protein
VIGIRQTGSFQPLELTAYDRLLLLISNRPPDPRLLIIGISESDLRRFQTVPISDSILAKTLEKLQKSQPKVIGIDIHRDLPQSTGKDQLKAQLQAPNVIVIRKGGEEEADRVAAPKIVPKERIGFSDLVMDIDGVIRRYLLYVEQTQEKKYFSFALRVALQYLGDSYPLTVQRQALQIGSRTFPDLPANGGGYHLEKGEDNGWQTLIDYRSRPAVAPEVSLSDLFDGKVNPNLIRNRIVLIGYTAPSIKDIFITPYSILSADTNRGKSRHLMAGVTIHAQVISQILDRVLAGQSAMGFLSEGGEWLWIWVWSLLGGFIVCCLNRPIYMILTLALAMGGLWMITILAFAGSLWLPLIPATIGFLGTMAVILGQKTYYSLYHDVLTSLPNRRSLIRDLEHLRYFNTSHSPSTIALLFLDIDRFKMFNEGLGNRGGDHVLLTIAERLQAQLQPGEKLARIGGDEFVVWLFSSSPEPAIALAKKLQSVVTQPIPWQEAEMYTSVSIGIASESLSRNFQPEEILRHAHIAMGSAKVKGGANYEIFTPHSKIRAEMRLQLENELRHALDHQEFQLYYQPIISLKTGKIAGFEALIRWPSAKQGFISPGQFIPIAEETGIIVPLGQWILQSACEQIRQWHRTYPQNPPLIMSVNLSSRQFSQPDLVPQVKKILQEAEIDCQSLKLEITESMMMNNVEEAIELLQQLKDLGLRLSIDDFGTGYSNLSYLHRFPVDTLKVDQSFVRRLHEGEDSDRYLQIVRTVVSLGHNLQLDVIAEGIETEAQMNTLKELGCEYGQGYYFAKPVPQEAATELLGQNPSW